MYQTDSAGALGFSSRTRPLVARGFGTEGSEGQILPIGLISMNLRIREIQLVILFGALWTQ